MFHRKPIFIRFTGCSRKGRATVFGRLRKRIVAIRSRDDPERRGKPCVDSEAGFSADDLMIFVLAM
jgi:hypothetical protein